MILPEAEGGLRGARDPSGTVVISNKALIDKLSFNLKPLKERHKQVCGYETCHFYLLPLSFPPFSPI